MSPIEAGAAYIPVTIGVGISSGISTQLLPRIGSRPLIVAGTVIGALGVFAPSRIPTHGSYVANVLPGLVAMALGLGAVFVGVQNAANVGVPAEQAGLAAALISASSTLGGALGLAILSAIAASRTHHLLAAHASLRGAHVWLQAHARGLQRPPGRRSRDRRPDRQHPRSANAQPGAGRRPRGCLKTPGHDQSERAGASKLAPASLSVIAKRSRRDHRLPAATRTPAHPGKATARQPFARDPSADFAPHLDLAGGATL